MIKKEDIHKVALYARVSSDEDMNRQNPENQLIICREYAKNYGYEVFKEYVDHASGGNPNRPAMNAMMEDAKMRRFHAVIVVRQDRVMRDAYYFLSFIKKIEQYNIAFITTAENYDTSTPEGKFAMEISSSFASLEKERISQRIREGMNRKRKKGERIGRPKSTAYSDSDIVKVRDAMKADPSMSLYKAAIKFNIPRSSLRRELSKLKED